MATYSKNEITQVDDSELHPSMQFRVFNYTQSDGNPGAKVEIIRDGIGDASFDAATIYDSTQRAQLRALMKVAVQALIANKNFIAD